MAAHLALLHGRVDATFTSRLVLHRRESSNYGVGAGSETRVERYGLAADLALLPFTSSYNRHDLVPVFGLYSQNNFIFHCIPDL